MNIKIKQMEVPKKRNSWLKIFQTLKVSEGFEVSSDEINTLRASASSYKRKHKNFAYTTCKTNSGYNFIRIQNEVI